jgi:hypothetical protein
MVKASGRRPIRNDVPAAGKSVAPELLPIRNYPPEWALAKSKDYLARYQQLVRR